jgi:hypothetical protein
MDSEMQVVEVLFFVDTMALLSNKTNGYGQAIPLYDTITGQPAISLNPDAIFALPNTTAVLPGNCYANPIAFPNELTHGTRYHFLAHHKFPVKMTQWVFDATNSKMVQGPGDNQLHYIDIPLAPITMPFTNYTVGEPYMNNVYMLLWGNTSTTTSNGYYSICHYSLKVVFEDIGE